MDDLYREIGKFINSLEYLFTLLPMVPVGYWVVLGVCIFMILAAKWDKMRHMRFALQASREIKRVNKLDDQGKKIVHLRNVNPFVFEEMILTAFKRKGYKIVRNKKYTGDGGIDGKVIIKGVLYLIQAKRYKSHINPSHVLGFSKICNEHNAKGMFVHTGKTGAKSKKIAENTGMIMISGNRLLNLFEGK